MKTPETTTFQEELIMYIYKTKLKDGLTAATDEDLLPIERETYFSFDDDLEGYFRVDSSQKPFIDYLLNHEEFKLKKYTTKEGQEGKVFQISGKLPVSCFRLKQKATDSMNYISRIMS